MSRLFIKPDINPVKADEYEIGNYIKPIPKPQTSENNQNDYNKANMNRSNAAARRQSRMSFMSQMYVDPEDFENFIPTITDEMLKPELALWQKAVMIVGCIICGIGMISGVVLIILSYNRKPNTGMLFTSLSLVVICSMVLYGIFVLYGEMEEESIEENVAEVEMYKETMMTQLAAQQSYES